jgi:hypothetical protein
MIVNAPTGISWNIIPFPKATSSQQVAEQMNMCVRATGIVDSYCNQILQATVDTEVLNGPDYRLTIQNSTGNARLLLSRWPVTEVLQLAVAGNTFPRQWQVVPSDMYEVERPPIGIYGTTTPSSAADGGQPVLLGAGYVTRWLGRQGYTTSTTYNNGWPHTSLTTPAEALATTVTVDDVTAFTGAMAFIYDGSQTETVTVQSVSANTPFPLPFGGTTPAGPGTLTLTEPLQYDHASGVVLSSLPGDIMWATILATTVQALEAGITAVTVQNLPGSQTTGGMGILSLQKEYQQILGPYRRVI